MTSTTPITTIFALTLTATAAMAQTYQTGMQSLSVSDPAGRRALDGFVWYPTLQEDGFVRAHGNMVWDAIQVAPDAAVAAGAHPLVVLSHGMFGNARNQAWLAQRLVAEGYIVAAIDHPGTSTFSRDATDRRELWERPRDISRTIDHLLADDRFGGALNADQIYMAGHSLGGFTAMALAGGRFDTAQLERFCAAAPGDLTCGIFAGWDIAKTPEDSAAMEMDLSDARIKAFAIFDLGGTQSFSEASLAAIDQPMLVYGAPNTNSGINLDTEARALAAKLPAEHVRYLEPDGLAHFDFLGTCTEKGLAILKEEEPDDVMVCENGRDARRAAHDQIAADLLAFFPDR